MKRDIRFLSEEEYDLVIIGGGITGAGIARDAIMRGLSVILLEKGDFGSGTSSKTSKLVHGGFRYLKTLEFGMVWESLRERKNLLKLAPHLVRPLPNIIPCYKKSKMPKWLIGLGMVAYEFLSRFPFGKNLSMPHDKKLPTFKSLSVKQILELEPDIQKENLQGGYLYYDCQMISPERLTLDILLDAQKTGACLANYTKIIQLIKEKKSNKITAVKALDLLTGKTHTIRGKVFVNATGPWSDLLLENLNENPPRKIIRSQGIHIITRNITNGHALILSTKKGRHFFILPWEGLSLIGTTDKIFEGSPDDYQVMLTEIREFIEEIKSAYPKANICEEDILFFYGGLRPLVETQTEVKVGYEKKDNKSYKASRKYEVIDHGKIKGPVNLISSFGGKFTTSRKPAEKTVNIVLKKIGLPPKKNYSSLIPLFSGYFGNFDNFVNSIKYKYKKHAFSEKTIEHLCKHYGEKIHQVIFLGINDPHLLCPIPKRENHIFAEVVYAVEFEMAQTLADVIFRRTAIGTVGNPGEETLRIIADIMGKPELLNWDDEKKKQEIDSVLKQFKPKNS